MRYIDRTLAKSFSVTLVSSAPEVQYVALRNIDLLLQKQPDILSKEMRVFFCKYNDPPYLKMQKLEIMVRIANDKNVDQLLGELKEYAMEVDMDFVRRAVKAIGQVAIKIESASEKCVNTLLDLINTKVNYVVQEAIVVIKDIFRKYPGYEGIIPTLCQCIDELDEPNARASLIWIVGEYAEKIENAGEILTSFVDTFAEEFTQVPPTAFSNSTERANRGQTQLQILTAVVKLFLKKPDQAQDLVTKVLQAATAENDNPDIRDRAYIYWRLLSSDPQIAKVSHRSHEAKASLTGYRTSCFPTNLLSLLPSAHCLPSCSKHYSQNSRLSPPCTTNHQKHSLGKADLVPRPCNELRLRNNRKKPERTQLPQLQRQLLPVAKHLPLWRIFWT